jgi:hypothetical protein
MDGLEVCSLCNTFQRKSDITCTKCNTRCCDVCTSHCMLCKNSECKKCYCATACAETAGRCGYVRDVSFGFLKPVCTWCRVNPVCQFCGQRAQEFTWRASRKNTGAPCVCCDQAACGSCLRPCRSCGLGICLDCALSCGACSTLICAPCAIACAVCRTQTCDMCVEQCSDCGCNTCWSCTTDSEHGRVCGMCTSVRQQCRAEYELYFDSLGDDVGYEDE